MHIINKFTRSSSVLRFWIHKLSVKIPIISQCASLLLHIENCFFFKSFGWNFCVSFLIVELEYDCLVGQWYSKVWFVLQGFFQTFFVNKMIYHVFRFFFLPIWKVCDDTMISRFTEIKNIDLCSNQHIQECLFVKSLRGEAFGYSSYQSYVFWK